MIAQFEVLLKNCFFPGLVEKDFVKKKNPKKGCTDATGRDREEERKKGKKKKGRCFPLSLLSVSGSLKWSWCSSVSCPAASPAPATPQGSEPALRGDTGRARPGRGCPGSAQRCFCVPGPSPLNRSHKRCSSHTSFDLGKPI